MYKASHANHRNPSKVPRQRRCLGMCGSGSLKRRNNTTCNRKACGAQVRRGVLQGPASRQGQLGTTEKRARPGQGQKGSLRTPLCPNVTWRLSDIPAKGFCCRTPQQKRRCPTVCLRRPCLIVLPAESAQRQQPQVPHPPRSQHTSRRGSGLRWRAPPMRCGGYGRWGRRVQPDM